MKVLYSILILLVFLTGFFIISGCSTPSGGSGSSSSDGGTVYSSSVEVSGKVTLPSFSSSILSGSNLAVGISYAAASSDYKIVAIYHDCGGFYDFSYNIIDIDGDGNFTFSVKKGKNFIAFLVDTSKTYDKVIGIIGIKIDDSIYWEDIQTSYLNGNINLGTISTTPAESIVLEGANISSVDVSDLTDITRNACLDDFVRFIKNQINNNSGGDNRFYSSPSYAFLHKNRDGILNVSTLPTQMEISGYQIYLSGEDIGDVYDGMGSLLPAANRPKLYPSNSVSQGNGTTYSSTVPIPAGYKCEDPDRVGYDFITGDTKQQLLQGTPPVGAWILENSTGTKKGEFDYSCAYPMRNGKISVPIPIVKVNSSDNDKIDSFEIKWYLLDKNGTDFEELSSNYVNKVIDAGIEICDFLNSPEHRERMDDLVFSDEGKIIPTDKWYFTTTNPSDGNYADYIGIYYKISDVGYRFVCRKF